MGSRHPNTSRYRSLGVILALVVCLALRAAESPITPPTPLDPIFPAVVAAGTVPVAITTSAAAAGTRTVSFGVPFPRGYLTNLAQVRLETTTGQEVACDTVELARWRHFTDSSIDGQSIRSVLVTFQQACTASATYNYVVRWGSAKTLSANLGITPANVATTWGPQAARLASEHPATDNYTARDTTAAPISEPYAWATLPAAWLMRCNLRGPVSPINDATMKDWLLGFNKTYVNDTNLDVVQYEIPDVQSGLVDWATNYEVWLFDRPFAIWNVYLQTGDVAWLRHAHRATQYYASWIALDDTSHPPYMRGAFRKKEPSWAGDTGDLKYSHPGGMFAAYLLTGDGRLIEPIKACTTIADTTGFRLLPYAQTSGLYTERHLAAGLAAYLYAYEATGDTAYKTKVQTFVTGMQTDVDTPPAGYPTSAQMAGVLLHRPEVHEGDSYADMIMSPFMAALLNDVLMHYYLLSDDPRALGFMSSYAQFVADKGLYYGESIGYYVPWYIVGMDAGHTDSGEYSDYLHSPDVLGLLARGRWARIRLGLPIDVLNTQIGRLRETMAFTMNDMIRHTTGLPIYRNGPMRRVGWWFGTNESLAWFGVDAADTAAPSITGLGVGALNATSASIVWSTSEAASAQVEYGTSTAYGSTSTLDTVLTIAHTRTLTGLTNGATYHYRVTCHDLAGNAVTSTDQTFTTPGTIDTTPPNIVTPASGPAMVGGTSATLSVVASDAGGGLTYAWAVASGPAGVTFTPAATTTATFAHAGTYTMTVTVRDAAGNQVTSTTGAIVVAETAGALAIAEAAPTVASAGTITLHATVLDQFGAAIAGASLTWSVVGGGTVSGSGVFTAPTVTAATTSEVHAASGALSAQVTVAITAGLSGGGGGGNSGGGGEGGCGAGGAAGAAGLLVLALYGLGLRRRR